MNKGTILGFHGSWSSSIATLVVKNEKGVVKEIPCENTSTVRALDACFGNVIQPGRTARRDAFVGKTIFYEYDDLGLLLGEFIPACDVCHENPATNIVDGQYLCDDCG
jgi:hypothetical protein